MKLNSIVETKAILGKLVQVRLTNFKLARQIALFAKRAEEELKFFTDEEAKLINKYADKDVSGNPIIQNNSFNISNAQDKAAYISEITNLKNLDIELAKLRINVDDFDGIDLNITPEEIILLDEIIDFEE